MTTSITNPKIVIAGIVFFVFEALFVASVGLVLASTNHMQFGGWKIPVLALFWISFAGLLVMTLWLRRKSVVFASIGWPTLLVGFLLGLITPTL